MSVMNDANDDLRDAGMYNVYSTILNLISECFENEWKSRTYGPTTLYLPTYFVIYHAFAWIVVFL